MNTQTDRPGDDWLDELLREDARRHVDDDGFTNRVITALLAPPMYRQSGLFRFRHFWPVAMTLVACIFAFVLMPGAQVVYQGVNELVSLRGASSATLTVVVTLGLFYWLGIAGALDES